MNRFLRFFKVAQARGQSLVETAIFMPVILILLGGVVEVGNLLVTQNRVSTAARVATGFGASQYRMDYDWGDPDDPSAWAEEMTEVAMNNVTETLDLAEPRWDIWTIKATLYDDASEDEWLHVHAYGEHQVVSEAEWEASLKSAIEQDVRGAITNTLDSDGLGIIATVAFHDRSSLLGLNAFNYGPLTRVRGLNVMRIDQEPNNSDAAAACNIIPIAIQYEQYSLYPSNWYYRADDRPRINPSEYTSADYPGDPVSLFPPDDRASRGGFETPKRQWEIEAGVNYDDLEMTYAIPEPPFTYTLPSTHRFAANWPGIPISHAEKGLLYRARLTEGEGSFGWLDWDGTDPSRTDLLTSLDYPGDFATSYPGSIMDTDPATGNGNGKLEIGEWVKVSTGNMNSTKEPLFVDYILPGRTVIMIVYDETNDHGGSNKDFRVAGFAMSKIIGFNFTGEREDRYVVFEFLGWAEQCNVSNSADDG